jgi:hypothetical protein
MVTILAFIVLGGGAYAAFHLPRNSVRSKNIVNRQVKRRDLGAPLRFKEAGLANLPGGSKTPCMGLPDGWYQNTNGLNPVAYARDPFGVVHLHGDAFRCGNAPLDIFRLPPGFRPANREIMIAAADGGSDPVNVFANGFVRPKSSMTITEENLDGLTFRCGPSKQHGCP